MRKFLWLLLLVLFTGFIFFNSSMSAETSHKLAHLAEFAMLAVIMVNTFIAWRISNRVASGYILFLGLAVAVADEYIQLSVPGRNAQITDIVLDFCGIFIIWCCRQIWLWSKK